MQACADVAWTAAHEGDLCADFHAIYGLDVYALDSARFFTLAGRVVWFEAGIVHRKAAHEREKRDKAMGVKPGGDPAREVSEAEMLTEMRRAGLT